MKPLRRLWEDFEKRCLDGCTIEQRHAAKKLFYSGAYASYICAEAAHEIGVVDVAIGELRGELAEYLGTTMQLEMAEDEARATAARRAMS